MLITTRWSETRLIVSEVLIFSDHLSCLYQALQETLLNMDKLNYEGKLDNGFHNGFENIDGEDGSLNVSLDGE